MILVHVTYWLVRRGRSGPDGTRAISGYREYNILNVFLCTAFQRPDTKLFPNIASDCSPTYVKRVLCSGVGGGDLALGGDAGGETYRGLDGEGDPTGRGLDLGGSPGRRRSSSSFAAFGTRRPVADRTQSERSRSGTACRQLHAGHGSGD